MNKIHYQIPRKPFHELWKTVKVWIVFKHLYDTKFTSKLPYNVHIF